MVAGNDLTTIDHLKRFLNDEFSIKDLGQINYYLGIEISRTIAGFYLNQRKYALDLIEAAGLSDSKPLVIPLDPNVKLHAFGGELLTDASLYM